MDAQARIVTLMLLGCACWRRADGLGGDPQTRYIYRQPHRVERGLLLTFNRRFTDGTYAWRIPDVTIKFNTTTETPFEPRLIDFIPETLFMQFIRNLSK